MVIITLFGKDQSKQVIKPSSMFEEDKDGNKLSKPAMEKKAHELALDLMRANYLSHSVEILN